MATDSDRQILIRNVLIGLVLIAGSVALTLMWTGKRDAGRAEPGGETAPRTTSGTGPPAPPPAVRSLDQEESAGSAERRRAETVWREVLGRAPAWPGDLRAPRSCEQVEVDLVAVCDAIADERDVDSGEACELIRGIALDLSRQVPQVSGELREPATALANGFHIFRVVGAKRLARLRPLIADDTLTVELQAMTLYRWLVSRPRCGGAAQPVKLESLYDYATFVFNTLGGQAYLRRRAPTLEALGCFYALEVIDEADQRGHNPHGLDPRREIARCGELIAGRGLVLETHYRGELQSMAERWRSRGRTD